MVYPTCPCWSWCTHWFFVGTTSVVCESIATTTIVYLLPPLEMWGTFPSSQCKWFTFSLKYHWPLHIQPTPLFHSSCACVHSCVFTCRLFYELHTLLLVVHVALCVFFWHWEVLVNIFNSEHWPTCKIVLPDSYHPYSPCWKPSTDVEATHGLLNWREVNHVAQGF